MWVASSACGLGIARHLLEALECHAAHMGLDVLQLDTHRALVEARALYLRHGYVEIAPYNANPSVQPSTCLHAVQVLSWSG